MMFIESNKRKLNEVRPMQYVAAVLLGIVLVLPSFEINAKEDLYQAAEERLESKDYKKAQSLFEQLANSPEFQIKAKFGLARVAFFTKELDDAEELIEEVLEKSITKDQYKQIVTVDKTKRNAMRNAVMAVFDKGSNTGWTGNGHTGVDVEIFAFGKASEKFSGQHDNIDIAKKMFKLLGKNK